MNFILVKIKPRALKVKYKTVTFIHQGWFARNVKTGFMLRLILADLMIPFKIVAITPRQPQTNVINVKKIFCCLISTPYVSSRRVLITV